ncbi:MAG: Hsp20/alpha crystallin family protein [Planctomycetaceae bacterium]
MTLNLIPWRAPRPGLSALQQDMNRLVESFFDEGWGTSGGHVWAPSVDVAETPESYIVKAELPGLDPKEIEIALSNDTLVLRGEKKEEREEKGRTWHRLERSHGAFQRTISFPGATDPDHVEAVAEKGVLTITVSKSRESKPRRIDVKTK